MRVPIRKIVADPAGHTHAPPRADSRTAIGVLLAAGLLVTHLAAPSQAVRYAAYTAVASLAAYGLRQGVLRSRPHHPRGWRLLEVGLWLHAGYGLTLLAQVLRSATVLLIAESVVDNVAHLFMAAAAVRFLAIRRPGGDRDGLLDGAVVLLAGGLLLWQVHEQHDRLAPQVSLLPVLSAAAVALLMAAAVVVGVRLYVTDRPPLAFPVLIVAAAVALVGNLVVVLTRPVAAPPRWVELLWLLGVLLAAAAAHLPGMQLLGEPEPAARERRVSPVRVVALGSGLLISPALVVLWGTRATAHPRALAGVVGMLTVLVLWRIGRLITERELMRRELSAAQAQLLHSATHDPLTGLANRALFLQQTATALARGAASRPAVVFLDLDGFKAVNDTHGHAAGDELLTVVTARLRSCLRDTDLAARLGGDEFAVLLDIASDPDAPVTVARRLLRALREPITVRRGAGSDTCQVTVGASVGVAYALPQPAGGAGPPEQVAGLLGRADAAMYRAKHSGKNRYVLDHR